MRQSIGGLRRKKRVYFEKLKELFPNNISEIRGCGVIRIIQIVDERTKCLDAKIANKIYLIGPDYGIFIRNNGSELIIKPPLTITDAELELGFKNLMNVMNVCLKPEQELKATPRILSKL